MLRCLLHDLEDRSFRVQKSGDIDICINYGPKESAIAGGIHR
jgi:hypothetical protein